jgi:hypothetical protein
LADPSGLSKGVCPSPASGLSATWLSAAYSTPFGHAFHEHPASHSTNIRQADRQRLYRVPEW